MWEWLRARRVQVIVEGKSGMLEGKGRVSDAGVTVTIL